MYLGNTATGREAYKLQLAFETLCLRTICEQDIESRNSLGKPVADALHNRLADLRAATSINDLPAGNPRTVVMGDAEQLVMDLGEGQEIVLAPNHPNDPRKTSGILDWSAVTRVKVVRIGGIHG